MTIDVQRLGGDMAAWQQRMPIDPESACYADQLIADADRAENAARLARQAANRSLTYERGRPDKYQPAEYGWLTRDQDPDGMVSAWLARGPRALVLCGHSRVGKTYAAYAIANDAHRRGVWTYASTAAQLSRDLKPDSDAPHAWLYATGADLLLLDDLGREKITEWWLEQVHQIIDERCARVRRLIVTVNSLPDPQVAYDELADRYGAPFAERLIDDGGIVAIDGEPVRKVVTSW